MDINYAISNCKRVKKMSIQQLSAESGLSADYITKILDREISPTIDDIEALSVALKIPTITLMLLSIEKQDVTRLDNDFLYALQRSILNIIVENRD